MFSLTFRTFIIARSIMLLYVSFPASIVACGQGRNPTHSSNALTYKIDDLFKTCNVNTPGYGIAISIDGKTLYSKGYGSANLDYRIPISPHSVFDIASVSKQFTAACVALLILDKKLELNTPAASFFPALTKYRDTILIKHLIYNTSGLTDYYRLPREGGKSWITFNYFDIDECIQTSLSQDTLLFKPGDKWDYCNINFMLLTKIIEKITGVSFADFARTRLFIPIGMTETFIDTDITRVVSNRVVPYNLRNKENIAAYREQGILIQSQGSYIQHTRNSPHYGGSGVKTTVSDLLKWSANMISRRFGGDDFYDLLHLQLAFNHTRRNQALGLYFGSYKGRVTIAWDGGDWGVSSQLIRYPEKNVAIIVLSNLGSGESYRKANEIADLLIQAGYL